MEQEPQEEIGKGIESNVATQKTFSFGDVIKWLKDSNLNSATRLGWNGKNMLISLQTPTELSKMTLPYIYMKTVDDKFVPWLASQTDILADDWLLIN